MKQTKLLRLQALDEQLYLLSLSGETVGLAELHLHLKSASDSAPITKKVKRVQAYKTYQNEIGHYL